MQTSVPIASDSFSYSWLSNSNKSPMDSLEEPHRESVYSFYGGTSSEFNSIKLNPDSSLAECQSFDFDTSITHSPVVLVHADDLFSDGLLRPVFFDPAKVDSSNSPDPNQTKIGSSFSSRSVSSSSVEIHHCFLKRWRKSTQRTLAEFLRYVNQLRHKVRRSRKSIRVNDIDKTDWHVKRLSSSEPASPISAITNPMGDLHDHENSIYEAVLHCKKSIGGELLIRSAE
ncbi:hypothetical protein RIF29_15908 [Crotalaria pallida]|uniref:Membrane-associated kinase regulator 6 n=1 Tax=Crotalaria pallida TaxID=3830 RepID=A0AAN9IDZ7_CROPI